MKRTHFLLTLSALALLTAGCANNHTGNPHTGNNYGDKKHEQVREGDKRGQHRQHDPKMKEAMDECMQTVTKDDNGRPNREAMQSCMKEKGFEPPKRPEGKPLQREGGQTQPSSNY